MHAKSITIIKNKIKIMQTPYNYKNISIIETQGASKVHRNQGALKWKYLHQQHHQTMQHLKDMQ